MHMQSKAIGFLAALFASGCAYMPPVHVDASPADMEILAGQWKGEYNSPALGRHGTIAFKLVAAEGQAYGAVAMTPQGSAQPYERGSLQHERDTTTATPQLLTIRFVRSASGEITGMLDQYWDPDRNCEATTRFRGYLAKDVIEGTFSTTFDCGAGEASGAWQVSRAPSKHAPQRGEDR
jgi:hypothetical protein